MYLIYVHPLDTIQKALMNAMRVSSFVYVKFCGTNGNKVSGVEVVAVWGDCRDNFTDWGS